MLKGILLKEACPELVSEWHPTKNKDFSFSEARPRSDKKAWWKCRECGYEWEARIANRALGNGCPFCAKMVVGNHGEKSLKTEFPKLSAEWHPTKNGALSAEQVRSRTSRAVWWKCKKCGHEWKTQINNRVVGGGCSVCSGRTVGRDGRGSLEAEYPEVSAEWHPTRNNDLLPSQIRPGSNKKVWWQCPVCEHEWQAQVSNRAASNNRCPVCVGKIVGENGRGSLESEYPEISAEWHPINNGDLLPSQVRPGSHKQVWWQCQEHGHEWKSEIYSRALSNNKCPGCNRAGWTLLKTAHWIGNNWQEITTDQTAELITNSGITTSSAPGRSLLTAVLNGALSREDIENFKHGQTSATLKRIVESHQPSMYGGKTWISSPMKRAVLARDKHRCQACHSTKKLHIDHIFPESKGGLTTKKNLQVLCCTCNLIKADRIMSLEGIRARRVELGYSIYC